MNKFSDIESVSQVIVKLFDVKARNKIDPTKPLDETALPQIPADVLKQFSGRLENYGYELRSNSNSKDEYLFVRERGWRITVVVRLEQIHFCVPYARLNSLDVVFEVYQTASELCDRGDLIAWFVNDKRWLE